MLHVGERVKVHIGVLERNAKEERPLGSPWHIFSVVFIMEGDYCYRNNTNCLHTEL